MPRVYKWEEPEDENMAKWAPIKETLKEHRGQWALVIDGEQGDTVANLASLRTACPRKDGYAIKTRNKMDTPLKAWMMWDPDKVKPRYKDDGPSDLARQRDDLI